LEVCSDNIDNDCDGTIDTDCLSPCELAELTRSNVGCDYYPTVTANSLLTGPAAPGATGFHFAVAISNTSNQAAGYTITRGALSIASGSVAANSVAIVQLPWVNELRASGASIKSLASANNGAYHLVSDRPVTVYQYNPLEYAAGGSFSYTNDASLLFPTNAWTGDYRVAARNTWSGYSGFYAVVASEDATTVTLTPSPTGGSVMAGGGVAANGTGTIQMNRGDVLQVFSSTSGTPDLTGTHVTANKPIAVIGGHNCTNVPASIPYCDHIEESIPPVETLSRSYVVVSPWISNNTQKAELVRVIATANNTTWTYDPPQAGWPTSLATAGSYVELPQSAASVAITANAKILVAAYLLGQDAGGGSGDPAMTVAVATEQYRDQYLFHAPTNYNTNFVDIIAPTGAPVSLDGNALPLGSFTAIGGTGLSAGHFPLSNAGNGNHNVTSAERVGINVYGYGQYTSFWYPGGLDLAAIPNN
ncbi:MAG: IgGFc-binding protein, partial [Polyangiaceae bacterium]|nr:IgGFc-binding protein [Polyangiaceae bacterium]